MQGTKNVKFGTTFNHDTFFWYCTYITQFAHKIEMAAKLLHTVKLQEPFSNSSRVWRKKVGIVAGLE